MPTLSQKTQAERFHLHYSRACYVFLFRFYGMMLYVRKNIVYDDVVYAMKKGVELGFHRSKWSWIVFNFNEHQVDEASEFAKEIGINFEIVKSARWDGRNDPLLPSKKWLPESVIKRYKL